MRAGRPLCGHGTRGSALDALPSANGGLPAGATDRSLRRSSRVAVRRTPHAGPGGWLPHGAGRRASTLPGSLQLAPRVLVPRDVAICRPGRHPAGTLLDAVTISAARPTRQALTAW